MTRSELIKFSIECSKVECSMCQTRDRCKDCSVALIRELLLAEQKRGDGCAIEQFDIFENTWKCDKCGGEWTFINGGIIKNYGNFCPKCGLQILRIITHGWDEDGNETTTIKVRDLTEGESA